MNWTQPHRGNWIPGFIFAGVLVVVGLLAVGFVVCVFLNAATQ